MINKLISQRWFVTVESTRTHHVDHNYLSKLVILAKLGCKQCIHGKLAPYETNGIHIPYLSMAQSNCSSCSFGKRGLHIHRQTAWEPPLVGFEQKQVAFKCVHRLWQQPIPRVHNTQCIQCHILEAAVQLFTHLGCCVGASMSRCGHHLSESISSHHWICLGSRFRHLQENALVCNAEGNVLHSSVDNHHPCWGYNLSCSSTYP